MQKKVLIKSDAGSLLDNEFVCLPPEDRRETVQGSSTAKGVMMRAKAGERAHKARDGALLRRELRDNFERAPDHGVIADPLFMYPLSTEEKRAPCFQENKHPGGQRHVDSVKP